MTDATILDTLAGIEFLQGLGREQLDQLAALARICDFAPNEVVFRQSEPADEIYLVVFGRLNLELCTTRLGCRRVLSVGPGELLGRSAILEAPQMTATARTSETTRLVRIDAHALLELCERDPRLGYEFNRRAFKTQTDRLFAAWHEMLDVESTTLPALAAAGNQIDW
jgi:CRP/FNR family cyclic AMP-dependent transcriptional regulator